MSFEAFYEHMGPCPPGHSIDRIDNSRGYEPGNCRWASWTEQQRNRRSNRLVVVFGLPMTLTEACEGAKISLGTVRSRLEKGWNIHNALFAPLRPGRALKEVLGE